MAHLENVPLPISSFASASLCSTETYSFSFSTICRFKSAICRFSFKTYLYLFNNSSLSIRYLHIKSKALCIQSAAILYIYNCSVIHPYPPTRPVTSRQIFVDSLMPVHWINQSKNITKHNATQHCHPKG